MPSSLASVIPPLLELKPALVHSTGALALGLQIRSMSHPSDHHLRLLSVVASLIMASHNALLGALTAMGIHLLFLVRNLLSVQPQRMSDVQRLVTCSFFILAILVMGSATWSGWLSALITVGSCAATYAYFYLRGPSLRLVLGANALMWLPNGFVHDSLWQIAGGTMGALAAAWGAWKTWPSPTGISVQQAGPA